MLFVCKVCQAEHAYPDEVPDAAVWAVVCSAVWPDTQDAQGLSLAPQEQLTDGALHAGILSPGIAHT